MEPSCEGSNSNQEQNPFRPFPKHILMLSGKRKSGKDFLAAKIKELLPKDKTVIIAVAAPIKKEYAENHGLDFVHLLGTDQYKEIHRKAMVDWSEEVRRDDPFYFCRNALTLYEAKEFPIWIVADIRWRTDLEFFEKNFPKNILTRVRLSASLETRLRRGFSFIPGVDDGASECSFDGVEDRFFEHFILNDKDDHELDPYKVLPDVMATLKNKCS